jgi:hypothetical protein
MESIENNLIKVIADNKNFDFEPHGKHLICVEGNVYSGKTEFIKTISNYFSSEFVEFITNTNSINHMNIIFHSNKDKSYTNFFKYQIEEINKYVEKIISCSKPVIFIERCLLINTKIFTIYAKNKGMLSESEFNICMKIIKYYSDYLYGNNDTHILILRSNVNKCFENNFNSNNYYTPVLNFNTLSYIQNCYKKLINELKSSILNDIEEPSSKWMNTEKIIIVKLNYTKTKIKMYYLDFNKDIINNEVEKNEIVEQLINEFTFLKTYLNPLSKVLCNQKDWITVNPKKKWKQDLLNKVKSNI